VKARPRAHRGLHVHAIRRDTGQKVPMSRKKASSASGLGIILGIGLVVWVLSKIGFYLIVIGAVTLVGWLGWGLVRKLPSPAKKSQRTPTVSPPAAALVSNQPRELLPVDPKVFDDPADAKAAALKVFAAWTRQLPVAPQQSADLVRSVDLKVRHIGRLVTAIAERKAVWRQAPHGHSSPVTRPKLKPEEVDPWARSLQNLRSDSLYITECDPCAGQGAVSCPTCRGTQSIQCVGCGGARKAYGIASNGSRRLMNCKQCGAKGSLPCTACTGGKVPCSTCRGSGRAEHWLEIVETSRSEVLVAMESEQLSAFPWAAEGPQASPAAIGMDAKLLGELTSQGPLSRDKAVEFAPDDWVQSNWQKLNPRLGTYERIQSQSLQLFELPSIHLSYSLPGAPPAELRLEGRRMLVPPASADRHFEERARRIRLAHRILLALAVGIPLAYLFRGAYFWSAWVFVLTLCMAGAAAAAGRFVREWTLGEKGARRWGSLASVAAVLAGVLAFGAEPSLGSVNRNLSAGRLDAAKEELVALGSPDKPSHAQAWIAFHRAHALRGSELTAIAQDALALPGDSAERAEANHHLYNLAHRTLLRHLEQKNLEAAEGALAQAAPALQQPAAGKASAEQLAELNALVHETEYAACTMPVCRWRAAFKAVKAATTLPREQRLTQARAAVVDGLGLPPRPREFTREWVQRLEEINALAKAIGDAPEDEALRVLARQAAAKTQEERRKIPLIGANRAVAAELLRVPPGADASDLRSVAGSVTLYCAMKGERCVGVYLVGSHKGARVLNDMDHAATTVELLSQALGHPSSLPAPPKSVGGKTPTASTWKDGDVTIVARWNAENLMELRLGEVKP
jgi:hypothetical protein